MEANGAVDVNGIVWRCGREKVQLEEGSGCARKKMGASQYVYPRGNIRQSLTNGQRMNMHICQARKQACNSPSVAAVSYCGWSQPLQP